MLKKIAFLLLLIAPMSVFAQKFAHFKSMDIIPKNAGIRKGTDRHPDYAETI